FLYREIVVLVLNDRKEYAADIQHLSSTQSTDLIEAATLNGSTYLTFRFLKRRITATPRVQAL
ncbi:MAG: hypothetical protein ABFS45_23660, partial [Pseudomonadota bacterium]